MSPLPVRLPSDLTIHPALTWGQIAQLPTSQQTYIGSPSIVVLPDGTYVVSNDLFGAGCSGDTTWIHASVDRGQSWARIAVITGQWWSTLFTHRGVLLLMGTTREYGAMVIRRSDDGGRTWTTPDGPLGGLLRDDGRYHCAPQPLVVHGGRVWRAMEDLHGGHTWGQHFRAFMMSAPVEADLLRADSWTCSERLASELSWLDGRFAGWLEGNVVVDADGVIRNLLRVDVAGGIGEVAASLTVSADGTRIAFDPAHGFIAFPGGAKKFTIRRDPTAERWWAIVTPADARNPAKAADQRNVLALASSTDLRRWHLQAELLRHPDAACHGFQYVDWQFDGDDLILACRTAADVGAGNAANFHDANLLTFHRLSGFRELARSAS